MASDNVTFSMTVRKQERRMAGSNSYYAPIIAAPRTMLQATSSVAMNALAIYDDYFDGTSMRRVRIG